jgi:hypothetical protein
MRAAAAIGLACAITLAGCGSDVGAPVKAKVQQFVIAARAHDYATICDQVLAPSLVSRLTAAGAGCEQAMQVGFGGVQSPTLSIGKVVVSGKTATVITLTGAKGQISSIDAIELVKTDHGWRVASLGSPAQPAKP